MADRPVMIVTGSSRGIGRALVQHYCEAGYRVFGCSRGDSDYQHELHSHTCLDVADEKSVKALFAEVRKECGRLDALLNNAGIASMNHVMLTPMKTVQAVMETNVIGTFLFLREAAKLMQKGDGGRVVNFTTPAVRLKLAGEASYAAAKAAVVTLTEVCAREFGRMGITVNAVGPSPVPTDLILSVPKDKVDRLIEQQAIPRYGEMRDVLNVVDFFLRPESDFITGQVLYLGGF